MSIKTPPKSLPLRIILIVAFVGQIVSAVSLVGYFSFRNGQKAVHDLASQLRGEVTARIERELRGYFEIPHDINRLNADALARGDLDAIDATRGESQLYQQMVIAPTVAFVYCGSSQRGEFFGVLRSPDDGSLQLSYGNRSNNFLRYYYHLNVAGDRTYLIRQADKPFDARQRPWFKRAISAERAIWTDVYIAFTTGLPNITAALPVYDRTGQRLLGVCATDVVLPEEFRDFLRNLEIGQTGQAFVVDRQGNLISNSTDEPLMIGEGQSAKLLPATDSQDPLVRGTAQYLIDRFGAMNNIERSQQLEFYLDGKRQFLEVVPFRDQYGLDWLIAVVVPEADFMGQINANTRNTVFLCLMTLAVAIGISFFTARWMTRPILRVSQASTDIAKGDLDQTINPSAIAEINQLANSFNSMSKQLKESFHSLRQSESANRALVEAIPDLLLRVSGDGTYLHNAIGSDRLRQLFDNAPILANSDVHDTLPPEQAQQRMEAIQRALETRALQVYEQRLMADGKPIDEEVRVVVMGENEVLIMVRDITDRKRAEEALRIAEENYRGIYENALEGIFQSTPIGRFLSVNPAMARTFGYDSPEEMVETITDIDQQIHVDPETSQTLKRRLEQDGRVIEFEYRAYCRTGEIIWVEESTRAVRDDRGTLLYYEGIVQNITERKRREERLRYQLEALKVEIDQKYLDQEVNLITESSYFQDLQAELRRMNPGDTKG
ncbi:PAS domain S-box protein [Oscillatoria sp. FACHB-1407]|uniref:PAS domain S-box protein n=1 Tax=Oscillatoria sp. FACHB-1407 TaxID=2692847 RepID=UPI0016896972|nr:PAS domain S-box protein [Oscillatoria sp. FACHB-1407]MBD2462769.1 PAS domain S-box protein [Oscillatoria sp. FACHB-1407]